MVVDDIFEVTLTTRELRQILSALYQQDGDQSLYRRLAQLDPQPYRIGALVDVRG